MTKATSASTASPLKRANATSAGLASTPDASRNAQPGSASWLASCAARVVNAAFHPASRSPRAISASRSWSCSR
jgi:hypothetical protein